ncbi:uncharacterized protein EV422DRAFT_30432 [Fimicolochytrium jonesii]|uniref:uncharacterized protein n=1 Tax=Fimicolochytrium jonesii TaxID=1396493 RepID=UPI0022FE257D|nr:uncharacterized protein EV422DRAFT_30432 [Fimicolochytrium jonesii]KAI8827186.1 hypothetical protein EV422DRAFT_30432 [Fimicolochytrium jonesii]
MPTPNPLPPPGYWLQSLPAHPVLHQYPPSPSEFSSPDISLIPPGDDDASSLLDVSSISLRDPPPAHRAELARARPPLRLLAVHDAIAFVCLNCVPPRLRVMNLRKWKGAFDEVEDDLEAAVEMAEFKELSLPDINFRVKHIELNSSGRCLALVGEYSVAIVAVPRMMWTEAKREALEPAYWLLEDVHSLAIAKVLWHPLSEKHVHLVVLYVDGTLGIHNVSAGASTLEHSYHLFGTEHNLLPSRANQAGLFGSDLDEETFVSFSFGRNDGKWGSMTVYTLTKSGDVYSICPIIPNSSLLVPERLAELRADDSALQEEQALLGQYSQTQAYWRGSLIDELISDVKQKAELRALSGEPTAVKLPRTATQMTPKARGPFLFRPASNVSTDFKAANDIVCLQKGPLDVLVLAFESGMLKVCLDVDGSQPLWHIAAPPTEEEAALPVCMSLEDIDLGLPATPRQSDADHFSGLATDPRYPEIVYSYHASGVHAINVDPLIDGLQQLATGSANEAVRARLKDELGAPRQSEINLVVSTRGRIAGDAPVAGFSIITSTFLGYSYILLTSTPRLYGDVLPPRIKAAPSTFKEKKAGGYKPAIEQRLFQEPDIMRQPPPALEAKPGLKGNVPLSSCAHVPTLWAFFEHIKARKEDLLARHYAVLDLEKRIKHQQVEVRQQAGLLNLWTSTLGSRTATVIAETETKLARLQAKDYFYRKKLGLILQILMDETQPLTEAERRWIEELEALRGRFEEGFRPLSEKLTKQVKALQDQQRKLPHTPSKKSQPASTPITATELGDSQRRRIEAALKQEYNLLVLATQKAARVKEMVRLAEEEVKYIARTQAKSGRGGSAAT